jgi:hypothetical protein
LLFARDGEQRRLTIQAINQTKDRDALCNGAQACEFPKEGTSLLKCGVTLTVTDQSLIEAIGGSALLTDA